jgi:fatty acid synthase subunit alpha, fungi type
MLTNVLRLMGHVVDAKRTAGLLRNPALVLLPLSPNHGVFGGDGLVRIERCGILGLLQTDAFLPAVRREQAGS